MTSHALHNSEKNITIHYYSFVIIHLTDASRVFSAVWFSLTVSTINF